MKAPTHNSKNHTCTQQVLSAVKLHHWTYSSTEFTYNKLGLRESIQYPDGTSANYSYDPLGRLEQVKDSAGNVTNYSYDALNRLLEKTLPNGTTTTHTYNELGRLTELAAAQGNEVLDQLTYTHDPLGNITGIEKQRAGIEADSGRFTYSYDALSRLTEVKSPKGTHAYSYDSLGTRVSADINGDVTTYSYNSLNQLVQELSSSTEKTFEYDQTGNLSKVFRLGNLESEYHFNAQGLLERAITPTGTAQYSYNALGKRVSSTTEAAGHTSVQTDYLLDLTRPYHDLLSLNTNGETQNFIWELEDVVSAQSGNETNYYTHDHLLSPLRLIGHDGASAEALSTKRNTCTQQVSNAVWHHHGTLSSIEFAMTKMMISYACSKTESCQRFLPQCASPKLKY